MPQFHIDSVVPKESVYPYIVNFQNAYVTDKFKKSDCFLLQNEETGKKTIATELCDLIYTGEEENEDLNKTFILAHNKYTGKVRVIEVGSVELKPDIKTKLDVSQMVETSNLELSRKFGSKKSKKIMEQREKLKMNVQTVTEQMANATKNITEDQVDLSSYNKSIDSDDFYIPPINRGASRVEDVYDLNKILSESQYEQIYSELENSNCMNDLNPFLTTLQTENYSKKQKVLLIYANSLFLLQSVPLIKFAKKTFDVCPHSTTLNSFIFENFSTDNGVKRQRPLHMKDKALCHAIVFILLINNYKLDLLKMCSLLKYNRTSILKKAAAAGATLVGLGSKGDIQLKLPLVQPVTRKRYSAKF